MLLLPIIFKDEIIARAKLEINDNLNAKVEFSDINLSLFRSFPDFTLTIKDITIDGMGVFEGTRLAAIDRFRIDLDLMSVISGNKFEIERILVSDARVKILIDPSGEANYDIVKPSADTAKASESEEQSSFKLTLNNYTLKNIDLSYHDAAGAIAVELWDLDHTGQGDFTENMVSLATETSIKYLSVGYEGILYLSKVQARMDADLVYDQNSSVATFGDNLLSLNDLPLEFTGAVSLPDDKVVMDLSFHSPSDDIKRVLSVIPAIYGEGYDDMITTGTFQFEGTVKGEYDYADHYPEYDVELVMQNGSFRFPDLPASVDDINVKARIFNNTSVFEGLEIEVPVARASIGGNPLNARIILSDPMVNPVFDVGLTADLDMTRFSEVVPMEGYNFKGRVKADVAFAGDMAAVEAERYADIKAEGFFEVDSLRLAGDSIPQELRIDRAAVSITPQYMEVKEFVTQIGRSDFRLKGRVDNILSYMLKDEILTGNFTLDADRIDLNQLSGADEEEVVQEGSTGDSASSLRVVRLPENIDFKLNTSIRQLVYDNLMINDVVGRMSIGEGKASMEQLDMRMLGGRVRMNGSYDSKPEQPVVDMNFDLRNFDVRESYQKFVTIQELAPIMKNSSGIFSTKLNFKALLNQDMTPELSSLSAFGTLTSESISTSPKAMQKLSEVLKNPRLAILVINDLDLNYRVEDGRVETDPFKLTSGSLQSVVSGSMGLDKSLDYTMDMRVPLKDIGAQNLLSQLGSDPNQTIDVKVFITGTSTDPKIKTSLKDLAGSIVDQAVDEVKKKVEEVVDDAKDQVNAKATELIKDAENKGDELIVAAQKRADDLVAEAEKQAAKLREEANVQARKIEDEAKGNFLAEKGAKVAADKVRDEADKRAKQLVDEARKQGNGLVDQARQQKVKLVEEAQEKAKIE